MECYFHSFRCKKTREERATYQMPFLLEKNHNQAAPENFTTFYDLHFKFAQPKSEASDSTTSQELSQNPLKHIWDDYKDQSVYNMVTLLNNNPNQKLINLWAPIFELHLGRTWQMLVDPRYWGVFCLFWHNSNVQN